MTGFKYILGLDTAMAACSASLFDVAGDHFATKIHKMPRGQAEHLVPMVQEVVSEAGISFQDIDAIATTVGPGAFTGLRIGLSTARSFGLALDRPVIGCTTTDVLARQFFGKAQIEPEQILAVLLETKRKDFYVQSYNADGTPHSEAQALEIGAVLDLLSGGNVVCIGDVLPRFQKLAGDNLPDAVRFTEGYDSPDPEVICRLCADYAAQGKIEDYPAEPLYLRGADTSAPKKKDRIIAD